MTPSRFAHPECLAASIGAAEVGTKMNAQEVEHSWRPRGVLKSHVISDVANQCHPQASR